MGGTKWMQDHLYGREKTNSTRCYLCDLEHTTSQSLVLFMNKAEIIDHAEPSHQVNVRTLRNNVY